MWWYDSIDWMSLVDCYTYTAVSLHQIRIGSSVSRINGFTHLCDIQTFDTQGDNAFSHFDISHCCLCSLHVQQLGHLLTVKSLITVEIFLKLPIGEAVLSKWYSLNLTWLNMDSYNRHTKYSSVIARKPSDVCRQNRNLIFLFLPLWHQFAKIHYNQLCLRQWNVYNKVFGLATSFLGITSYKQFSDKM